ncbi:hypothetical protein [Lysinibacillus sp. NPDC056220]|uniref:hypothetical protein n=1 Tax=Lysinibacillus sp. NPDC056220 TaxID=3398580 RepID=UPI0013B09222|nr:hypothetical protein GAG94_01930 [Lysinibacillus sphaericus]
MKEDLCGIVYSLINVPTSVFQQQWDYWFNLKKQTLEDDMEAWQLQQKKLKQLNKITKPSKRSIS